MVFSMLQPVFADEETDDFKLWVIVARFGHFDRPNCSADHFDSPSPVARGCAMRQKSALVVISLF